MANSKIKQLLSEYINVAHDNEDEFLRKFWYSEGDNFELLACYIGIKKTEIKVSLNNYNNIGSDFISTDDFIGWCEDIINQCNNPEQE